MKKRVKKLIPSGWKRSFREYILSLVRTEQIQNNLVLAKRINEVQAIAHLNQMKHSSVIENQINELQLKVTKLEEQVDKLKSDNSLHP